MASLREYIGSVLTGDATVIAIAPAARIWYGDRPQEIGALPAINYFAPTETQSVPQVVATVDYQLSARAVDYATAVDLADAITGALVGRAPDSAAGVDVQAIEFRSRFEIKDPDIAAWHVALTLAFVVANISNT